MVCRQFRSSSRRTFRLLKGDDISEVAVVKLDINSWLTNTNGTRHLVKGASIKEHLFVAGNADQPARTLIDRTRTMKNAVLSTLFAFLLCSASAQVVGTPSGFAAGTTGGGNATPQTPSSLDEYVPCASNHTNVVDRLNESPTTLPVSLSSTVNGALLVLRAQHTRSAAAPGQLPASGTAWPAPVPGPH